VVTPVGFAVLRAAFAVRARVMPARRDVEKPRGPHRITQRFCRDSCQRRVRHKNSFIAERFPVAA